MALIKSLEASLLSSNVHRTSFPQTAWLGSQVRSREEGALWECRAPLETIDSSPHKPSLQTRSSLTLCPMNVQWHRNCGKNSWPKWVNVRVPMFYQFWQQDRCQMIVCHRVEQLEGEEFKVTSGFLRKLPALSGCQAIQSRFS